MITVLFITLYFQVIASNQFFTTVYINTAGLWNKTLVRQILAATVNLGLDILLGIYFGITGIVFASFITSLLIVYPFDMVIVCKYVLKSSVKKGIFKMIAKYLWFIALGAISFAVCQLIPFEGVSGLLLRALVCLLIPNGIYFVAVRKTEEFKYLWDHAKSLIKNR